MQVHRHVHTPVRIISFSYSGDLRYLHSFPTRRSSDLLRLGRLNFLGKLFSPGRLSSTEGRSHLLLNFGGLGFEALALRFSGFFLLLKRASDGFCSGHLRFGLLCASLQARGRFLRLPAAGLERVRGGFEFLWVFAALCQGFPREPLRKIAGQLLELRGPPARQVGPARS